MKTKVDQLTNGKLKDIQSFHFHITLRIQITTRTVWIPVGDVLREACGVQQHDLSYLMARQRQPNWMLRSGRWTRRESFGRTWQPSSSLRSSRGLPSERAPNQRCCGGQCSLWIDKAKHQTLNQGIMSTLTNHILSRRSEAYLNGNTLNTPTHVLQPNPFHLPRI